MSNTRPVWPYDDSAAEHLIKHADETEEEPSNTSCFLESEEGSVSSPNDHSADCSDIHYRRRREISHCIPPYARLASPLACRRTPNRSKSEGKEANGATEGRQNSIDGGWETRPGKIDIYDTGMLAGSHIHTDQ